MATAFRSVASIALANRTNTAVSKPTGTADGDILIAVFSGGLTSASILPVTGPAGWTEITGSPVSRTNAGYTLGIRVYSKVASSEGASWTWTHGAADSEAYVIAITGGDTTTPVSPNASFAGSAGGGDGLTITVPGLTTPRNDSFLIFVSDNWDHAGLTAPAGTTPTFTTRYDNGASGVLYGASGVLATAGATGTKTQTSGNTSSALPWLGALICVQAAPGGAAFIARRGIPNLQAVKRASYW